MSTEAEIVVRNTRDVQRLSAKEIRRRMDDPKLYAEMQQALATPYTPESDNAEIILSPEEVAAAEAQKAADEVAAAEAAKKAAEDEVAKKAAAEAAKKAADDEAARKAAEPQRQKLVLDYQVTDDAGNPIGNKTHLEAWSTEEMLEKMKQAHINAMRLAHRLRNQKPTAPKPAPAGLLTKAEFDQAQADILGDDKEKAAEARKKLIQHNAAAQAASDVPREEKVRQAEVSYQFMSAHINDFYPCAANSKILTDYLKDNNLEFNFENLEFAFVREGHRLAPRPGAVVPVAVPNPPVPTPEPPAPLAPPAPPAAVPVPTPPAASAPVPPAAVPNPPAPAPRQAPNGGIEPGTMGGGRATQSGGLTLKDVAKWSAAQMKKNMADPKTAAVVKKLIFERNEAVRKAKQLA